MSYLDCPKPLIDENDVIRNKDIKFINDKNKNEFEFWVREKSE